MELKEAIILVIVIMVFTVIVTILKGQSKKGIGYVSMTFHQMFHLKVGILKVDGSRQFSMVIENKSDVDVVIKDMYLEIKKGARYEKQPLPDSAFDNTKTMTIPPAKSGAAFLTMKEFKKYLNGQTILKAVAEDDSGKAFKSKTMQIDASNMKLELKA